MKAKVAVLSIIVSLMVVLPAYAAFYSTNFPYTRFNTTSVAYSPTNYEKTTWILKINNDLTYNSTTSSPFATIRVSNSSSTHLWAIDFNMAPETSDPTLFSLDIVVPTKVDPSSSDWVSVYMIHGLQKNETIVITCKSGNRIVVGTTLNPTKYYDGYTLDNPLVAAYIGTKGSGTFVATAGNIAVTLDTYSAPASDIVLAWIPLIISLAMLGVTIGMVNKFGR